MEHVEAAGHRIGYERSGQGDPLLLLDGLPGDGRLWRRQLAELGDEFALIAWDAPGFGDPSDPEGSFGLNDVASCLCSFIGVLELERPHVVGLSWGAGLALELYRIAPTIPRCLVLASVYAGWAGSLPADVVAHRLHAYMTAAATPRETALRDLGPGFFSPTAPAELVDEALAITSEFHPAAFASLARSFAQTDLRSVLPSIEVPTLVLHGDADTRSPLDVGRALRTAIPGSQMVVLPGVGHASNMEAPHAFNAEARRFLRPVSSEQN